MIERPWTEDQARWLVRTAARLAELGAEPVGPMVTPDARFFPDRFDQSAESVAKLFQRILSHVGLSEVPHRVALISPDDGAVVSSCSSGGCSSPGMKSLSGERVSEQPDGSYLVTLAVPEVAHATALTAALSRAAGHVFLSEVDALGGFRKGERARASDLAATLLGLGVLIANGSGISVKGCGGVKIHSVTSFSAPEAVLALALAVERAQLRHPEHQNPKLEAGLDAVARSHLAEARAFMANNRDVVRRLDDAPEGLLADAFTLRDPNDSLGRKVLALVGLNRLFSRPEELDPITLLEQEAARGRDDAALPSRKTSSKDAARLRELSQLVEESLAPARDARAARGERG